MRPATNLPRHVQAPDHVVPKLFYLLQVVGVPTLETLPLRKSLRQESVRTLVNEAKYRPTIVFAALRAKLA